MQTKIYKGTILNPTIDKTVDVIFNGFIEVENGKIVDIGKTDEEVDGIIIPGFVDVHIHLPQFDVRGTFSGNELLPWLKNYIWLEEAKFSDLGHVEDVARRFYKDLIKHGTLTAMMYGTIHEKAVEKMIEMMPIRGRVGKVMMDQNAPDNLSETTQESIEITRKLCEKYGDKHVITPRFAPSCTMESMQKVAEIARKYDCYVQSHLSENQDEITWVKELFPESKSYTDVYYQAGLLGSKTIMGHVIHCTDEELQLLKDTGTKIAHCPTSNVALKSGTMPLDKIIEFDIPFALATDVGAGPKTSMLDTMRSFLDVHSSENANPQAALYYATLAGAQLLGYEKETGSLEKGKSADFLVLNMKAEEGESADSIIKKLTHESDYDTIVKDVYLAGRYISRHD